MISDCKEAHQSFGASEYIDRTYNILGYEGVNLRGFIPHGLKRWDPTGIAIALDHFPNDLVVNKHTHLPDREILYTINGVKGYAVLKPNKDGKWLIVFRVDNLPPGSIYAAVKIHDKSGRKRDLVDGLQVKAWAGGDQPMFYREFTIADYTGDPSESDDSLGDWARRKASGLRDGPAGENDNVSVGGILVYHSQQMGMAIQTKKKVVTTVTTSTTKPDAPTATATAAPAIHFEGALEGDTLLNNPPKPTTPLADKPTGYKVTEDSSANGQPPVPQPGEPAAPVLKNQITPPCNFKFVPIDKPEGKVTGLRFNPERPVRISIDRGDKLHDTATGLRVRSKIKNPGDPALIVEVTRNMTITLTEVNSRGDEVGKPAVISWDNLLILMKKVGVTQ